MEDRLTRIAEMAQGTVGHKDLCWLISEIERLRLQWQRVRHFLLTEEEDE